jgi:tetratricopeptide (TPR) repeat protein
MEKKRVSLIQNSADSQEIKKQLSSIKLSLETCLSNIYQSPITVQSPAMLSPAGSSIETDEWSDLGSNMSAASAERTDTSLYEVLDNKQPALELAGRFDRALMLGRQNGPRGENIRLRIQQLNAAKSASIGAAVARSFSPPTPHATSTDADCPSGSKIRALARSLASQEANTSGLWSKESAMAAQVLAKAYQEVEDFESALEYYHQAFAARDALFGSTNTITLNTADLIAGVFEFQSRWQEALEYYQLSLAGRASNPSIGPSHPSYLPTAIRVARMHSKTGETESALQQYESILDQYQATPNKGATAATAVKAEIAKIHLQKGDLEDGLQRAEVLIIEYQNLLESREASFGPGHRLTIEVRSALESIQEAVQHAQNQTPSPSPIPNSEPGVLSPELETTSVLPSNNEEQTTNTNVPLSDPSEVLTEWAPEIEAYERKLEEVRKANGDNDPETLELMCNLADAYSSHEQYEPAISWFHEALRGQEITCGKNHPTTLTTVHNLGVCYTNNKDNASGLQLLERSLAGRKMRLPPNHPDTLSSMVQIAKVYEALSEFSKAIEFICNAIAGLTEKYGAKHPTAISANFQLAKILHKKGSLQEAQTAHEKVLKDKETIYSPTHPLLLASKVELGLLYREQGERSKGIALLHSAYEGQKITFGELHATTIRTALELAQTHWGAEQWHSALDFYIIVLKGLQDGHDAGPTTGSVTMTNIALCYFQLEMYQNALSWFERVFKLYETAFGKENEKTITALTYVARACVASEKYDDAIHHYHRILAAKELTLPDSDESVMLVIFQLSNCNWKSGQNERFLVWGKRFLEIGDMIELEQRLIIMKRMGNIHAQNGEHTEALELYQEFLSWAEFLDNDHWLRTNIVYDIQNLYAKMDNDTKVVQDLQKRREVISQLLVSDARAGVSLLCQLGHVHARQHMDHEALSLFEEALEAIQGRPQDSDWVSLKHSAISGIADAHLTLHNNQAAMTYLQVLIDSEEDESWKSGAFIRMASAQENDGNFEKAIELWKQVRREEESRLGIDNLDVLRTARKIGALCLRIGNTGEALRWTQGALAGMRRSTDPDAKIQEMNTLSLMSSIHLELGDLDSALTSQRDCAQGLEAEVGELDERTVGASLDLAEILNILGYEREALWWYRKAISGYKSNLGNRSLKVMKAEQKVRELEQKGVIIDV